MHRLTIKEKTDSFNYIKILKLCLLNDTKNAKDTPHKGTSYLLHNQQCLSILTIRICTKIENIVKLPVENVQNIQIGKS